MFSDSPLFTKIITAAGFYLMAMLVIGLISGKAGGQDIVTLFVCLIGASIPVGLVLVLYKILEKHREKNPAKESVQRLKLDE